MPDEITLSAMTASMGPGTLEETLARIKALGLERIDLSTGDTKEEAFVQIDKYAAAEYPQETSDTVRQALDHYGMVVDEVFLLFFGAPINHPDPAQQTVTRRLFPGFCDFCNLIGAQSILLSPGFCYDELGEDASRARSFQELRWLQSVSADKGLALNIEPHLGSLAIQPEMAMRFGHEVPGLGLTLDYSHFICKGYDQLEIEPLHAYASHFHARQACLGMANAPREKGTIDFGRMIAKLIEDDYRGAICLEYDGRHIEDAWGETEWLVGQLREILTD